MKAIVLSDSHGDTDSLCEVARREKDARIWIFLGDGLRDFQYLRDHAELPPTAEFCCVRGNNDWGDSTPESRVITVEGHRLFLTHGHLYGVKTGLYRLSHAAHSQHTDWALFGHTHQALLEQTSPPFLLNPGSVRSFGYVSPSYGVLTLKQGRLDCKIVFL